MSVPLIKKVAMFTDIHFGKANNSIVHNKDCLDFVKWFIEQIKFDEIDHIVFLGDWFDHRNSLNIETMNYSYQALKLLNNINIPIKVILGNHDLYQRHTRDIHSLIFFQEFDNVELIESIHSTKNGDTNILFLPFIFEEEYGTLLNEINAADVVFCHAEFKGFVITGDTKVLEHGPDHTLFQNPKRIFTGHFHKRQAKNNIFYIGNTFPMNFSDANDTDRGYATYEYEGDQLEYHNWLVAPSYIKCNLSTLMEDHKTILRDKASVKCLDDIHISIEESAKIREKFIKKYNLREFYIEEETESVTSDEEITLDGMELESTDAIIKELLKTKVDSDILDKDKLIKIYEDTRAKR